MRCTRCNGGGVDPGGAREGVTEAEFEALVNRVVGALAGAEGIGLMSVEYVCPEWVPNRLGVDLACRDEPTRDAVCLALRSAGVGYEVRTGNLLVIALADSAFAKKAG